MQDWQTQMKNVILCQMTIFKRMLRLDMEKCCLQSVILAEHFPVRVF